MTRRHTSDNRIVSRLVAGAMLLCANAAAAQVVQQGTPVVTDSVTLKQAVAHMEVSKFVGEWLGRSGKLLARFVAPSHAMTVPVLSRLFGDESGKWTPRVERVASHDNSTGREFNVVGMQAFDEKADDGYVGTYRMGFWPAEKRIARNAAYENPEGFIKVTPDNVDMYISEHFRLGDFVTHDQPNVWPKYVVVREELLDKLELVIDDLKKHGVAADYIHVLSGFRTPQYNNALSKATGRADDSRHQFGDAADIYIDTNNSGTMADLNKDGKVDMKDSKVILAAVARVEAEYPELVGGTGVYHAQGSHGPFAHIDVRGSLARWVRGAVVKRPRHKKRPVKRKVVASRSKAATQKTRTPTAKLTGG